MDELEAWEPLPVHRRDDRVDRAEPRELELVKPAVRVGVGVRVRVGVRGRGRG